MDQKEISRYEGVLACMETERRGHECSIKDLINATVNLEYFDFLPGIVKDTDLGENALDGDFLRILQDLPDEVIALMDPAKVGAYLRHSEKGAFTRSMTVRSCRKQNWGQRRFCLYASRSGTIRKMVMCGFFCPATAGNWSMYGISSLPHA